MRATSSFTVTLLLAAVSLSLGCRSRYVHFTTPAVPRVLQPGYDLTAYESDLKEYEQTRADPEQARQIRNKIAYSTMAEIDGAYGQYTADLFRGRGTTAIIGETAQLGLTAAATVAVPVRTKTIISAVAAGITGVNLSFDKNLFAQQTFQTIAIGMQTRRDKARLEIVSNLSKSVAEYPLAAARRDLVGYFYAGTLVGGLQQLQEDAAKTATENPVAIH